MWTVLHVTSLILYGNNVAEEAELPEIHKSGLASSKIIM